MVRPVQSAETCRWSYKLCVIRPAVREKHSESTFLWLSVAFTILLIYKVESDSSAAAHAHCRLYVVCVAAVLQKTSVLVSAFRKCSEKKSAWAVFTCIE